MRDSFIFYRSWFETIAEFPKNQQLDIFFAIMNFALNDEEPDLSDKARMVFNLIKPLLEANNKRYKDGCKGGRPKNDNDNSPKKNLDGIEYFTVTEKQYNSACERLGKDVVDRAISLIDGWFARKKETTAKDNIGRNNYGYLRADNSFVVQAKKELEKAGQEQQPNWSI